MNIIVCRSMLRGIFAASAIATAGVASASPFSQIVTTVTSSGYYSGEYGVRSPDLVFDGKSGNGWQADEQFDPQHEYFISIGLSMGVRPSSYTITEGSNTVRARRPKSFKLYASATGGSWVEIDSRSNVAWQDSTEESLTFSIDPSKLEGGACYSAFKLVLLEPSASGNAYAFFIGELDMNIETSPSSDDYSLADVVKTARESEADPPFSVASTGEMTSSGDSRQLFDGDETADTAKSAGQNGRALFKLAENPSVTISFDTAAFDNRLVLLRQYGFRMANIGTWVAAGRMPKIWEVYVSDSATPGDDDWVLVECRTNSNWFTTSDTTDGVIWSNFGMDGFWPIRHVRFAFKEANSDAMYVQLGEICLVGLLGPDQQGQRDVSLYATSAVDVRTNGTAEAAVAILPRGQEVDPYDLSVVYGTGGALVTNLLEQGTCFTGQYKTELGGLRLASDFTLQFVARPSGGGTLQGDVVRFSTPYDAQTSRLPPEYMEVEWIESTDTGHQWIDCGFAPTGYFGFDLDFIGYNEFQPGSNHDTDNRKTGYGVYLGASNWLVLSSSTGASGSFPTGLFLYNGAKTAGLVRNERMRFLVGDGKYTTIVGATTNSTTFAGSNLTGSPNLFLAAAYSSSSKTNQFAVMRIYSLKTYNDGVTPRVLTHEFVPAQRVADGVYGLYDVTTDTWCPNVSATPFLAGPAERLVLDSLRYTGRNLAAEVTRGGTAQADVYAAWGETYGGIDVPSWEHTAKCGEFAENVQTAVFTTPVFSKSTVYVRFYTSDGKWSDTVYLPDQELIPPGLMIFVR